MSDSPLQHPWPQSEGLPPLRQRSACLWAVITRRVMMQRASPPLHSLTFTMHCFRWTFTTTTHGSISFLAPSDLPREKEHGSRPRCAFDSLRARRVCIPRRRTPSYRSETLTQRSSASFAPPPPFAGCCFPCLRSPLKWAPSLSSAIDYINTFHLTLVN